MTLSRSDLETVTVIGEGLSSERPVHTWEPVLPPADASLDFPHADETAAGPFGEAGSIDVLHVTESWGGGVQTAIERYIASSPQFRHGVLARPRHGEYTKSSSNVVLSSAASVRQFLVEARAIIRVVGPRVIHLHGSFAGVLRAWNLSVEHVIYTPHCYAFESQDQSFASRFVYALAEAGLASRGAQTIAAISPREFDVANRIGWSRGKRVEYLPNVVGDSERRIAPVNGRGEVRRLVASGRLALQKDPMLLAAAAPDLRAAGLEVIWIGDGNAEMRRSLESAGVMVTGWCEPHEVRELLLGSDLYIHTARWEGAPMSALEAAECGLPVLARRIAAMSGLGFACFDGTPKDLVNAVLDARQPSRRAELELISAEVSSRHSVSSQATALERIYGS